MIELCTVGYGRWPPRVRWQRLVRTLREANVQVLCDIRHSPCASNLDPSNSYGPRPWHLQPAGAGIVDALAIEGVEYRWLVELGNPQKRDRKMSVLREHLRAERNDWPVHRGLELLRRLVVSERKRCCLLCACKDYDSCHRKLVADAFASSTSRSVTITNLG